MLIKVNGEERELSPGSDILKLLAEHQLTIDKVAVELNRRLVRSEKYSTELRAGDEIEIVSFVGGG